MKPDLPADLIEKANRNAKAYEKAVSSGDAAAAKRLAWECATSYTQLARKVPLRDSEYLERAKIWKARAEAAPGTDIIGDEVATSQDPKTQGRLASAQPRHKVFISYSKPDVTIARDLCSYLENEGIFCWIAPRDVLPGENFPGSIIDAIDASKVVVLIFSRSSDRSPHVIRELTRAVNKDLLIIPFRLEDLLPSKNMTYLINIPNWFDAFPPPAQQYFATLAKTIKTHLAGISTGDTMPGGQGE
jgi:hypothetical protein